MCMRMYDDYVNAYKCILSADNAGTMHAINCITAFVRSLRLKSTCAAFMQSVPYMCVCAGALDLRRSSCKSRGQTSKCRRRARWCRAQPTASSPSQVHNAEFLHTSAAQQYSRAERLPSRRHTAWYASWSMMSVGIARQADVGL